ncbi:helix-turn-helix domain-containing protein [Nocardia sp. NPDC088792]|uniref:helix-turn-helix domain-containing protein n=1 Tax=Nocardia sp. NPDC088792 TaxID=3364332 RepID=UPI0037F5DB8C
MGGLEWTAREVRAFREVLGMSPGEFADFVKVTKRTARLWENGQTSKMHAASRRALDEALAKTPEGVVSRFRWALTSVAEAADVGAGTTQLPQQRSESGLETVLESANQSAALLAWAEASNVGPMTIEDMRADLRSVTHGYLKEPTLPLFQRTVAIRDKAITLLSGRQSPRHSAQLYGIAGWALAILGWVTVDLGHPDAADKHLRTAWVFADNAEDDDLRAWVRASQHTAAFWREDYAMAAGFAEDGLRYARNGTAALFLSSAHALDLVLAHRGLEASSALDGAVDIGARVAEQPPADPFGGPFSCSVERAGGFWADICLSLGDPARSLQFAQAAVDGYVRTPVSSRNLGSERMVRCQQIKAQVMLGDLDVVTAELEVVAATPPEHRVGPLMQRVEEIAWMARDAAGEGTRGVRAIEDSVAEFRRHSDLGSLPVLDN